MQTGQGKTWTARRVQSLRMVSHSPSSCRTSKSAGSSVMASCRPSRSCAARPTRSAPATSKTNGSRPIWRAIHGVASTTTTRNRCFPPFEKEEHNESVFALGRKAWLFAGSDRGAGQAAFIVTLIMTAKLNGVDSQAWLADILAHIADMRSQSGAIAPVELGDIVSKSRCCVGSADGSQNRQRSI